MKNKTILVILIFLSFYTKAQDNCTIKMNTKIQGLPPEYAAFGEQESITYIKGEKVKSEITSMMFSQTLLFDGKKQVLISDKMDVKTGYSATIEELNIQKKNSEKPKIEYTNEKKIIAGLDCLKATLISTDKNMNKNIITVWITDKINSKEINKFGSNKMIDMSDLKGYPLEIEMNTIQNDMSIKILITTSEVSFLPVDESNFILNTEGYTMMSYKEFKLNEKNKTGYK